MGVEVGAVVEGRSMLMSYAYTPNRFRSPLFWRAVFGELVATTLFLYITLTVGHLHVDPVDCVYTHDQSIADPSEPDRSPKHSA